jgi:hypothetical protein
MEEKITAHRLKASLAAHFDALIEQIVEAINNALVPLGPTGKQKIVFGGLAPAHA